MAPSTPGSSPRLTTAPASPLSPRSHRRPPSGDPVLCPFCSKELPASLVCGSRSEAHEQSPTSVGAGGSNSAPVVPTAALMTSEGDGDRTETLASKAAISEEDIRRWSSLAGVIVSETASRALPAQPPAKAESKPVPLLPPPPPGARASPKPAPGRFGGLFSSKKSRLDVRDDDSDDESDGVISGYAKLGAPGSDDDGDDDYESDKEIKFKPRPREERPPTPATDKVDKPETHGLAAPIALKESSGAGAGAGASDAELRFVLREVLSRVAALSQSHAELQSSHTTLLTSLKIARSNLVMAEANTEMLEAELKRAKSTAAVAARARPEAARSFDVSPIDTRASTSSGKQGWFGRSKASSPTEATTRMSGETTSPTDSDELRRLRIQVEAQNAELEALKKGKKEIESELEGLSQALFEEANKMVADERRKRAELEETLQEVKGERQALRETVKVLGGRIQTPPPIPTPHEAVDESPNLDQHYAALRRSIHHVVDGPTPGVSESGTPPEEEEEEEEEDEEEEGETPTVEKEEEASDASEGTGPKESPELRLPGGFGTPSFDSEPNPWAAPSVVV